MIIEALVIAAVVTVLAAAWLYPYVSGIVLKARMLKNIREKARSFGYRYKRLYKNIFFVKNKADKYDVIIYDAEKLYAVKLWSSYFVRSRLIVTEKGGVYEERPTMPVFLTEKNGGSPRVSAGRISGVPLTKPAVKNSGGRRVENFLLIYPSYKEITVKQAKGRAQIESGDELFGKTVVSPSFFVSKLEKESLTLAGSQKNEQMSK